MTEFLINEFSVILDNNLIDEIGITLDPLLPPLLHVDTKLGIAKSILKPVFTYAIQRLYKLRSLWHGEDEHDITDICKNILDVSRVVLIVKGDFPVAYDMRKSLISGGHYSIQQELKFTSLLFTRHPKCPSGWQHRRWCLTHKCTSRGEAVKLQAAEVETERELCRAMAEAHPKNYYAWVHRLWLLQYSSKYQIEEELYFTKAWLQNHVSDHSAVNHRIQVIKRIMADAEVLSHVVQCEIQCAIADETFAMQIRFLSSMFAHSAEVITSRPGHESLWCLRRSLLEILFRSVETQCGAGGPSSRTIQQRFASLSVTESQFADLCVYRSSVINECTKKGDATTISFDCLSSCICGDSSTECPLPTGTTPLGTWLLSFLASEMRLVRACVQDDSAWDYAAQRLMALRYAAFLLDRTAHYCVGVTIAPPAPGRNSALGAVQFDAEHRSATAGSDGIPLSASLRMSLLEVCEQLNVTDKYSRLWLYKRAEST